MNENIVRGLSAGIDLADHEFSLALAEEKRENGLPALSKKRRTPCLP